MALSVVQTLSVQQSYSGSFASNVTAGNSVIFALSAFTTSTATISSSAPLFNGSAVTGGALLVHAQSTTSGTNQVYGAIWLLPNLAGGAKSVAVTVTNGGMATAIGFTAWEVSGLGASPSVDKTVSGNGATGTTLSSGTTAAISAAPEFIAAMACSFGNAITKVGAPWTEVNSAGGTDTIEGEQIVTSSGGTYSYAPVAAGSAGWVSMIATIEGTSSGTSVALTTPNIALAAPLVTPAAGATVALTAPNVALAAPLVTPSAGATVALTAPNVTFAAPLLTPTAGATLTLTTPNVTLAAPLLTPSAGASLTLTAPNVVLAAPLVSPAAGGSATVALTTPNVALAAPLVTPSAGATVGLVTPNIALAAPLLSVKAGATLALTTPGVLLAAPPVTTGGVVAQQGTVTLGSALNGSVALASAAPSATLGSQLNGTVTIESTI